MPGTIDNNGKIGKKNHDRDLWK